MTDVAAASTRASLVSSPDGQWVAIRKADEVALLAGGVAPATARVFIGTDDADVVFVGPPTMVVVVVRNVAPRVMLYSPPNLEVSARHDLDQPMRVGAITGARIALVSPDNKKLVIVRVAGNALGAQSIDLEGPLDFIVGLDKGQLLLSIQRKLEVWDATTGRALLRMQLQLPPPPRVVGTAQGHLWVTRPNTDDVIIYRLSDGRPFRHHVGAPTVEAVGSTVSPIVIVGTQRGLVRVHCFAHSLTPIEAPWSPGMPITQLAVGDDVSLLGLGDDQSEPWRVPIAGAGAPAIPPPPVEEPIETIDDLDAPPAAEPVTRFRALRDKQESERVAKIESKIEPADRPSSGTRPYPSLQSAPAITPSPTPPAPPLRPTPPPPSIVKNATGPVPSLVKNATGPVTAIAPPKRSPTAVNWRERIAAIGAELVNGGAPELTAPLDDSELAELADRLMLSQRSLRTLIALYALYLVGEPELSIADLAQILGDWTEPLGTGELAALAILRRKHGRVSLRGAVTDLLDGMKPRSIRIVGAAAGAVAPTKTRTGAWRYAREGKSDAEIELFLSTTFGRIAVVEGDPDRAILEARLRNATAVAFHPPPHKPRPWPRDAGLVLVLYGSPSSWIADLPSLE